MPQGDPILFESTLGDPDFDLTFKSRGEHLEEAKSTPEYDLLVIGGGATGSSVTLGAANAGLKTLMVDSYDFMSGTSSKSTKLIHGGNSTVALSTIYIFL